MHRNGTVAHLYHSLAETVETDAYFLYVRRQQRKTRQSGRADGETFAGGGRRCLCLPWLWV